MAPKQRLRRNNGRAWAWSGRKGVNLLQQFVSRVKSTIAKTDYNSTQAEEGMFYKTHLRRRLTHAFKKYSGCVLFSWRRSEYSHQCFALCFVVGAKWCGCVIHANIHTTGDTADLRHLLCEHLKRRCFRSSGIRGNIFVQRCGLRNMLLPRGKRRTREH